MKKKKSGFGMGFAFGVICMLFVGIGIGVGLFFSGETVGKKEVSSATEQKVNYLKKLINTYYLEDADETKLKEGMYKGLLAGLQDPYSVYYTEDEYQAMMEETQGTYYGIGALVSQDAETGVLTAVKIFEDSPARKAGMQDGDILSKVEDNDITGEDINNVVSRLKGEKGTKVNVTVYRAEQKKYIDMSIIRDEVKVPTVTYKMLDKKQKIGYIQISQFEEVTYDQFVTAIQALKKQGMKAVVFDVRNNPGGLYNIVCDMLDYLLPEGTLVSTKDKYGNEKKETSDKECLEMPMVVLQNESSASASEIFAGAIQDFGAGRIVGTQSFGKGIVQTILPLTDGSAVKLTIEKYYTPKGENIHGKGITPDVLIEAGKNEKDDVQLKKAQEVIEKLIKNN